MDHLAEGDVAALMAGELTGEALHRALRHLLSGCPACRERLFAPAVPEEDYAAALRRTIHKARRLEPRIHKDLERCHRVRDHYRAHDWKGLSQRETRYNQPWAHVEALLARSFDLRYSNPREMRYLAQLAVKVADTKLKPTTAYTKGFFYDVRVRARAELANSCRVNEDFAGAEAALVEARALLPQGTGDALLAARLDDVEASLWMAQMRHEEAIALLDRLHATYLELGERHLAGRALIKKGMCVYMAGRVADSCGILRAAIALLDPARDPEFMATAYHDLLTALVDAGKFTEAGRLLLESGLRQKLAGDPLNLLRLRWVEGKILAGRGRLADAERVLAEVRAGFRREGLGYDAALAGMDLATVLLRQGKADPAHQLARELRAACREHRIHGEAVYALVCFEALCRKRAATVAVAERIRGFLASLQRDPRQRFDLGLLLG